MKGIHKQDNVFLMEINKTKAIGDAVNPTPFQIVVADVGKQSNDVAAVSDQQRFDGIPPFLGADDPTITCQTTTFPLETCPCNTTIELKLYCVSPALFNHGQSPFYFVYCTSTVFSLKQVRERLMARIEISLSPNCLIPRRASGSSSSSSI